jgi:hypothetical protein
MSQDDTNLFTPCCCCLLLLLLLLLLIFAGLRHACSM